MKNYRFLKFLGILSFSIVLINCGRKIIFTSKIVAIKTSPFEDLRISSSVHDFKAAGFQYGDLVEYCFNDEDGGEHRHTVPFVSNCLISGLNQGCICDYEKSGKAISICLGFTKDYDDLDMNDKRLIGADIVFTIHQKNGWREINDKLSVGAKNTYESVGRNKYTYVNMRDIKRVSTNIFNSGITSNTIYRTSSPYDSLYNNKRYSVADSCVGDIINSSTDHYKKTILVSLNHDNADLQDFYNLRRNDGTAPNFCKLMNSTVGSQRHVIGVNVGDNFFSVKNKERIAKLFKDLINAIEELNYEGYTIIFCDTEGSIRTGIVIFLLEALLDSSHRVDLKTLINDYMLSFANYYNIIQNDSSADDRASLMKDFTINRILYTLSCFSVSSRDYESAKGINWYTFKTSDVLNTLNVEKNIYSWVERYFLDFLNIPFNIVNALQKMMSGKKIILK